MSSNTSNSSYATARSRMVAPSEFLDQAIPSWIENTEDEQSAPLAIEQGTPNVPSELLNALDRVTSELRDQGSLKLAKDLENIQDSLMKLKDCGIRKCFQDEKVIITSTAEARLEQATSSRYVISERTKEDKERAFVAEGQLCLAIHLCMVATASESSEPTTNITKYVKGFGDSRYPCLADKVANYVFKNKLHLTKNTFWTDFDLANKYLNYEHPLGVQENEGGYFHRLRNRVALFRTGVNYAEYYKDKAADEIRALEPKTIEDPQNLDERSDIYENVFRSRPVEHIGGRDWDEQSDIQENIFQDRPLEHGSEWHWNDQDWEDESDTQENSLRSLSVELGSECDWADQSDTPENSLRSLSVEYGSGWDWNNQSDTTREQLMEFISRAWQLE